LGATSIATCLPCAAGFFNPLRAQSSSAACTLCAAGTYQPSPGQPSCIPCSLVRTGCRSHPTSVVNTPYEQL
jgi:hypothetical protein